MNIQTFKASCREDKTSYSNRTFQTPGGQVLAWQSVSINGTKGSLVALKGRSGSGKITLLNNLGGLDQPISGKVISKGQNLGNLDVDEPTQLRCEQIGFVSLLPTFSAFEHVEFTLWLANKPLSHSQSRAQKCHKVVGLSHRKISRFVV